MVGIKTLHLVYAGDVFERMKKRKGGRTWNQVIEAGLDPTKEGDLLRDLVRSLSRQIGKQLSVEEAYDYLLKVIMKLGS